MVEIIDKIKDIVIRVPKSFEITYNKEKVSLKSLETETYEIYGVIYQLDGEIDLFLRERD